MSNIIECQQESWSNSGINWENLHNPVDGCCFVDSGQLWLVSSSDIDECLAGTDNCFGDLVCVNTEGSFLCQRQAKCGSGYEFKFDACQGNISKKNGEVFLTQDGKKWADCFSSLSVADVDECILGTHNCGVDQICINTPGFFQCSPSTTCPAGFIKDAAGSCIGELRRPCEHKPWPWMTWKSVLGGGV